MLASLLASLALAAPAAAGPNLLLGVSDDLLRWTPQPTALLRLESLAGVQADRITLRWAPGKAAVGRDEADELQRATRATAFGIRVVVAVYGDAAAPPVDPLAQAQYCSFLASVVRSTPAVGDVVVWNEPNSTTFWRPQAPAAYASLLARCWDAVHAVRPGANVIAASAPRGATPPAQWYRALGAAYRASGRTLPLFDVVGHNVYPDSDAEPPSARHPHSPTIAEGDYETLVRTLGKAFPGRAPRIWYLEDGYQTRSPQSSVYTGSESVRAISPDDQAARLRQAIELAYCQPAVEAFFNFQLLDERSLGGWQSGLLYADGTPKPGFAAFRAAADAIRAHAVSCPR